MENEKQMSESVSLGIILALAGGYMDAYSYLCRGEVFANAQTGNLLLLGVYLSEGNYGMAIHYFCPVMAFALGIILSDVVRYKAKKISLFHWRQTAVLCEAVVLLGVSFIPQEMNLLANCMTSLACGVQVESFRKIHGNGIATTMCIGNLRSGTQNLCDYFLWKERGSLWRGILYYGIILCFMLGAILSSMVIRQLHEQSISICSGILFIAFLLMFTDGKKYTVRREG